MSEQTHGQQRQEGVEIASMSVAQLLASIGSRTPTPGGGAVAAVTAALAAAVSQMVVSYSAGRKSLAEHAELHAESLRTLTDLADTAIEAASEDAAAFEKLSELWKLPEDDEARKQGWDDALRAAIDAPMKVLSAATGVLHMLVRLHGATNRMLDSDLAIGAILAEAAARCAAWNVRINLPHLTDRSEAERVSHTVIQMLDRVAAMSLAVETSTGQ